jgi:hypothetical protein
MQQNTKHWSLQTMKTGNDTASATVSCKAGNSDPAKLVSLLALAAGAVAMPQTSNADIIYTDLSADPGHVGFASGSDSSFVFTNLPGTVQFGFQTHHHYTSTPYGATGLRLYRTVTAGRMGTTPAGLQGAAGFVVPLANGANWNTNLALYYNVAVGVATDASNIPGAGYNHEFLGFKFADTTQGGALLYGWIEISLNISTTASPGGGPTVTIYGYAFDSGGVPITMGATPIPEPAPMGILALGALILGAKGLRSWRRQRVAMSES